MSIGSLGPLMRLWRGAYCEIRNVNVFSLFRMRADASLKTRSARKLLDNHGIN